MDFDFIIASCWLILFSSVCLSVWLFFYIHLSIHPSFTPSVIWSSAGSRLNSSFRSHSTFPGFNSIWSEWWAFIVLVVVLVVFFGGWMDGGGGCVAQMNGAAEVMYVAKLFFISHYNTATTTTLHNNRLSGSVGWAESEYEHTLNSRAELKHISSNLS